MNMIYLKLDDLSDRLGEDIFKNS